MQNKQTEKTNIEERFEQPKKTYQNKQKQGLPKKKNKDCFTATSKEARENDN